MTTISDDRHMTFEEIKVLIGDGNVALNYMWMDSVKRLLDVAEARLRMGRVVMQSITATAPCVRL